MALLFNRRLLKSLRMTWLLGATLCRCWRSCFLLGNNPAVGMPRALPRTRQQTPFLSRTRIIYTLRRQQLHGVSGADAATPMTTASNVARLSALHPETGDARQRRRRTTQTRSGKRRTRPAHARMARTVDAIHALTLSCKQLFHYLASNLGRLMAKILFWPSRVGGQAFPRSGSDRGWELFSAFSSFAGLAGLRKVVSLSAIRAGRRSAACSAGRRACRGYCVSPFPVHRTISHTKAFFQRRPRWDVSSS